MRIDMFLNKVCLVKTRSIAKNACDKNLVFINDKHAKSSQLVKSSDLIRYSLLGYETIIKVICIPDGNVSKKNALDFYEIVSRVALNISIDIEN